MRQRTVKYAGNILLELTAVVLIASICITLCTPTRTTFPTTHMNMVHIIRASIDQCRLLALKTQESATLCSSNDGLNCSEHWQNAQLICQQHNETRLQNSLCQNYPYTWHANFGNKPLIVFRADGSTTQEQGHFTLGCTAGLPCSKIYINFNGSARLARNI